MSHRARMMAKIRGKRDANEKEIVTALRDIGATVHLLDGPVDLLVGYEGKTYLLEVKQPKGKLTPKQVEFIADWPGDVHVVTDPESAFNAIAA